MRRAFGIVAQITLLMVVIILPIVVLLFGPMWKSANDVVVDHEKVDLNEETQLQGWQLLQRINLLRQDALHAASVLSEGTIAGKEPTANGASTGLTDDLLKRALPPELLERCLRVEVHPASHDGNLPPSLMNYCDRVSAAQASAARMTDRSDSETLLGQLRQAESSLQVQLSPTFYREREPFKLKKEAKDAIKARIRTDQNPDPWVCEDNYNVVWAGVRVPSGSGKRDDDWILLFALGLDESFRGITGSSRHLGFLFDEDGMLYVHPTHNPELAQAGVFDQRIQKTHEMLEPAILGDFEPTLRQLSGMDIAKRDVEPRALTEGLHFYFCETDDIDLDDVQLVNAQRLLQTLNNGYLDKEWRGESGVRYRRASGLDTGLPRIRMMATSVDELERMRSDIETQLQEDEIVALAKPLTWGFKPVACEHCLASQVRIHLSPPSNGQASAMNDANSQAGISQLTLIRAAFAEELTADLKGELSSLKSHAIWVGILGVAATLGLSLLITRPLKKIASVTREIGWAVNSHRNDESPQLESHMKRLPVQRQDEIGELARAFQYVVQQVMEYAARIRQRESFLRKIHDTAMDGIMTIDDAGRIRSFNPAAEQMFGRSAKEVLGEHFGILYTPSVAKELTVSLEAYLAGGEAQLLGKRSEVVGQRRDGTTFPLEISMSEIEHTDGGTVFASLLRDVTERKQAETARQLLRANEEKTHALREIAHETIGDLTSILGAADQFRRRYSDTMSEKQAALLRRVERSARSLVDFVEDLREIARINEGSVELQLDDFSPREVIEDVLGMLNSKFAEKHHIVRADLERAPDSIQGDKSRIRQVIKNLLSNACKYTPEGGRITINTTIVGDDLRIEVIDTGIGIPAEDRHKIFREFSRASNADTIASGQGLGLALSRRIIEMHWGQIDYTSAPGIGTTFWIQMPMRAWHRRRASGPSETVSLEHRPLKILLADFNEQRANEISTILGEENNSVVVVTTGFELVESVASERPDLVMTVLSLPGLNANDAVQLIRGTAEGAELPIVLLSRAELPDVRAQGFSDWLRVPIERDRLRQILANIVSAATPG